MASTANRVQMSVASAPGTGAIPLGSPTAGAQSLAAAGIADGEPVEYLLTDGTAWELGIGVYASAGPTLSRGAIRESSAAGVAIAATAAAVVSVVAPAQYGAVPEIRATDAAYLMPPYICGSASTRTMSSGTAYAQPTWVYAPVPVTKIGAQVTTAGSSSIRLGLYRDAIDGASRPGALIADGGTLDNTGTGLKEAGIATTILRPGTLYWLLLQSGDAACVVRSWSVGLPVAGRALPSNSNSNYSLSASRSYSDWPTDLSGLTWNHGDTASSLGLWVRK